MSGLSCFPSGGPVSKPGAPHPGAGSSEAPRGREQRDSEDCWQVSETFKILNKIFITSIFLITEETVIKIIL